LIDPRVSQSYPVERVIAALVGARGNMRLVRFLENNTEYISYVPDDSLWGAVKDNLLLSEYERAGVKLSKATGVVVDAGAHVGLFSLRASAYAKRVISLEPHPLNLKLLELNLSLNEATTVIVLPNALWWSNEDAMLFDGRHSGDNSLLTETGPKRPVSAITLDDVVSEVGPVDLLKMDIEGAEMPVLLKCEDRSLHRIGSIAAELHYFGEEELAPLQRRLEGCGFRVTLLEPPSAYWADSISRTLRRWKEVEGLTRVKATVLSMYTVGALLRLAGRSESRPGALRLKFLYASRDFE
jgi:FkbM family methyltransferase